MTSSLTNSGFIKNIGSIPTFYVVIGFRSLPNEDQKAKELVFLGHQLFKYGNI